MRPVLVLCCDRPMSHREKGWVIVGWVVDRRRRGHIEKKEEWCSSPFRVCQPAGGSSGSSSVEKSHPLVLYDKTALILIAYSFEWLLLYYF